MFVLDLVWWTRWNALGGSTKGDTAQEKGMKKHSHQLFNMVILGKL